MADISKIEIENTSYDIKDVTARTTSSNNTFTAVNQNDFMVLNNGYTIEQYEVMANSNTIYGHIIVGATTPFGNYNSIPFNIKSGYRPVNQFYKPCGLSSNLWDVTTMGYLYMGAADCVIVSKNATYSYAILDFIYKIS